MFRNTLISHPIIEYLKQHLFFEKKKILLLLYTTNQSAEWLYELTILSPFRLRGARSECGAMTSDAACGRLGLSFFAKIVNDELQRDTYICTVTYRRRLSGLFTSFPLAKN